MTINYNPIIVMSRIDMKCLKKTTDILEELLCDLRAHSMSAPEDSCITYADNGEVIITEDELEELYAKIKNFYNIFESAPEAWDSLKKELAVNFI